MLKRIEEASSRDDLSIFAAALLHSDAPVPPGVIDSDGRVATKRFNVYRNNVVVSLIEALKARFPVVEKLVGDRFFAAMAREYVLSYPPSSPVLIEYGQTFPEFMACFPPAVSVPYLADVGRLENAWWIAYHAADALPLDPTRLETLPQEQMERLRFDTHPSLFLVSSPYAVFSIWQANRQDKALDGTADVAEAAMICRPALTVEVCELSAGAHEFFCALQRGDTLGQATQIGLLSSPHFDLTSALTKAFSARIFTDFDIIDS